MLSELNDSHIVKFLAATDDKEWNGQKKWFHIAYTRDVEEKVNPVITNTTNTVQSADSYFSNGVESFLMKTDADMGYHQTGGKYNPLQIIFNFKYSNCLLFRDHPQGPCLA